MSKSSQLGRAPSGLFAKGNNAALKTGVSSLAVVQARSEEVRAELSAHLAEHLPQLAPADEPMVDLAVDLLTKLRLVNEYLQRTSGGSLLDRRGAVRNSATVYLDLVRHCMTVFRELGIGPRARAGLLDELGLARDRKSILAREAQDRLRAKVIRPEVKELPSAND